MKTKPNIILILLDAARADHLSSYGYFRDTTPNIKQIAEQGILFENAFTTGSWSPPSHASLFTGKYPSFHRTLGRETFLNPNNTTMAEILQHHGYRTIGVTNNILIGQPSGFAKGFDEYIEMGTPYRSPKFVLDDPKDFFRTVIRGPDRYTYRTLGTLRRLLKRGSDQNTPLFIFTNFLNPHAPYNPPNPFKQKFCPSFHESKFFLLEFLLNKISGRTTERFSSAELNVDKLNFIAKDLGQFSYMAKEFDVSEREWEVIKSWYDGELSYLDFRLGQFFEFLKAQNMIQETLIVITSDHGDNFGDHGLASHHFCLYDTLIHVPLIMSHPGAVIGGKRIENIVSTVDILPTILEMLDIELPGCKIQGRSLYPFEDRKFHDFVFAESGNSVTTVCWKPTARARARPVRLFGNKIKILDKGLKCLRTQKFKYILSSEGKSELYDLQNDPEETMNISKENPDKVTFFRKRLEDSLDISFFGPEKMPYSKNEEEEILKRLQAMGYM